MRAETEAQNWVPAATRLRVCSWHTMQCRLWVLSNRCPVCRLTFIYIVQSPEGASLYFLISCLFKGWNYEKWQRTLVVCKQCVPLVQKVHGTALEIKHITSSLIKWCDSFKHGIAKKSNTFSQRNRIYSHRPFEISFLTLSPRSLSTLPNSLKKCFWSAFNQATARMYRHWFSSAYVLFTASS